MPSSTAAVQPVGSQPAAPDLRFSVACAVAREAGAFARRCFHRRPAFSAQNLKGQQDYLAATDAEVEALIRGRLQEAFPQDAFIGEEDGGEPAGADAVWVVDPVDGTANFVRGLSQFCVSIALVQAGRIEVGIIYDPMLDELYAARRGHGATLNGEPMRVSGVGRLDHASIEAGWSSRIAVGPYLATVQKLFEAGAVVRRGGSGALALANVAAGRIDGYVELHMNAWDALAGYLLIAEAGGHVTDFLADDGLTQGNKVLGCTPELREALTGICGIA